MQAGKSRENLGQDLHTTLSHTSAIPEENNNQLGELDMDFSILPDLQNDGGPPVSRAANKLKKFELELKKQELLSTCITVLKEPVPSIAPESDIISKCPFAIHVAEKLLQLHRRTRTIAEKRINDTFFDIKINGRNSFQSSGPLIHPISPDTSEFNPPLYRNAMYGHN